MLEQLPQAYTFSIIFFLAACIGSFLNVVVHRLPLQMMASWQKEAREILDLPTDPNAEKPLGLAWPPSACPNCNHRIRGRHNIPILGFLLLKAKCFDCGQSISIRYPLVELATALIFCSIFWLWGLNFYALALCGFSAVLITAALIDADTTLLPDELTLPLLWAGLLMSLWSEWPLPTSEALLGASFGYLSLWGIFWLFKLLTGKDGMGYGDFKLLAALGAWAGWQSLLSILILSSVVGSVFGLFQLFSKKLDRDTAMPFGPYLAVAGWITLVLGLDVGRYLS